MTDKQKNKQTEVKIITTTTTTTNNNKINANPRETVEFIAIELLTFKSKRACSIFIGA